MTGLCVAAIDPGLTGALAFWFPSHPERVAVEDMPLADGEVNVAELDRSLRAFAPAFVVVELVGPMPTDGSVQAFKFGAAYSAAKTTCRLAHVPMHLVTPQTWKKHFRLKGGKEGKEAARNRALSLFPASAESFARKSDHNRAEAALLARFAADTING